MTLEEYSEDTLVEQPAIALFSEDLKWETANCFDETFLPGGGSQGRETTAEVVLKKRLRPALERLNQDLPREAIEEAANEITRDRSTLSPVNANREIYQLIKEGVKVTYKNPEGETINETVRVIDWNTPENNDFFLASQFWITGDLYKRRADMIGFVNGIPLIFIELKASHRNLKRAFDDNLRDYKNSIPQLFRYNALIILSNGSESRIGTITAEWEHFSEWKRISEEDEEGVISLETMLRGTCEKVRLLDIVENFTIFIEIKKGTAKVIAKNHQYLGVNNAVDALRGIRKNQGKLGVFWHTQGSGKSYSMIFFSKKVLRKISGNWTFVVVTDRLELDEQIYKNFADSGTIHETEARAESGDDLKKLLSEDHRYIFTLIQKFRTEPGATYPVITTRDDIIVIADEAHRTQYDTLALNMRTALPNAAFIAFTGTPLIATEEKTREVFGDYVSVYTYRQSTDDGATVPLYYENRIPELQITNLKLNEDMERIIEEAELDPDQEKKLEREFSREYHLITRDDRLERIAKDIVTHFTGRGWQGKAMVVSIDKATAVRMYDKVKKHLNARIAHLKDQKSRAPADEQQRLASTIDMMEKTDMAVVVSQSQNEIEDLKKKGIDILPHRTRMVKEDLAEKFKDPDDPFRLVFVCAMWLTGFDAPSCSTIYLDKPMKNHTLMQTIARANRVFGEKNNGLIVDYYGVFKDLQRALAIYAPGLGSDETMPVQEKDALITLLRATIDETTVFCLAHGIEPDTIRSAKSFDKVRLVDDAVAAIIVNDESKRAFLALVSRINRLFRAIKPDPVANELLPLCGLYLVLGLKIRELVQPPNISQVMEDIEKLLDRSIATDGYDIKTPVILDLNQLDLEKLSARLQKSREQQKRLEVAQLRSLIEKKLHQLVEINRTRVDFLIQFQKMIDEYNAGGSTIDELYKKLVHYTQGLFEEEKRAIRQNLTEEELTIFDLLTKPNIPLTEKEADKVKKVARKMLNRLKQEKLVLDWRKKQQTRAEVRLCIEECLDYLPGKFEKPLFEEKCEIVYQYIFDKYPGAGQNVVYGMA
ncbi:type I restriction endonuclease subunit R [Methanoregula sp.]|uniref:type I restriction endonuclease subunit R n=1 Tax=Methanoregula sp. TaxID=2052170 RepID=UPI002BBB2C67|nr:type I restriction endonuclease subunit R [Methanoregula sp.]HVP95655.1 type I restriction endonuclease subunit R [Methanoregula sp.]